MTTVTKEWREMIEGTRALLARRRAIADRLVDLAYRQSAKHHPETGGHPLLIHNWGNDAAKAVWAREEKRYCRVSDYVEARCRDLWVKARASYN